MGALSRLCGLVVAVQCAVLAGEGIIVDEKAKTVSAPAAFAKQGQYDVLKGAIEYAVVAKGGKEYETVVVADCAPQDLHDAFVKIGLQPGEPSKDNDPPRGTPVRILVEYEADGKKVRRAVDEFIVSAKTGKPLEPFTWAYTGSVKGFDPTTDKDVLQAIVSKNLVGLHWVDATPFFQNVRAECREQNIYRPNVAIIPKPGTPVRLIFERAMPKAAEGAKRVHLFISGRVQGVGFRAFTQREASTLGVTGWVKNLADGRVEAVVEGPKEKVDALLEKLQRGPRAARVEKLEAKDEAAEGGFQKFDIRF